MILVYTNWYWLRIYTRYQDDYLVMSSSTIAAHLFLLLIFIILVGHSIPNDRIAYNYILLYTNPTDSYTYFPSFQETTVRFLKDSILYPWFAYLCTLRITMIICILSLRCTSTIHLFTDYWPWYDDCFPVDIPLIWDQYPLLLYEYAHVYTYMRALNSAA